VLLHHYSDLHIYFAELLQVTESSMLPRPKAELIKEIYDVRSWITSSLNDLHGHSQPHCFKFVCNGNGKAVMFHKNWSSSQWCSDQEAPVVLKVQYPVSASVCKYTLFVIIYLLLYRTSAEGL